MNEWYTTYLFSRFENELLIISIFISNSHVFFYFLDSELTVEY